MPGHRAKKKMLIVPPARSRRLRPESSRGDGSPQGEYPDARNRIELGGPLELLVATTLAQTTDVRVKHGHPEELFERYRTAADYAGANPDQLEEDIVRRASPATRPGRPPRGMARALLEHHGGEVPRTMAELVASPQGVGRKTANGGPGQRFRRRRGRRRGHPRPARLGRLGLTEENDPEKIEQTSSRLVPKGERPLFSTPPLILHGRRVCKARKPDCPNCVLNDICPSAVMMVGKVVAEVTQVPPYDK